MRIDLASSVSLHNGDEQIQDIMRERQWPTGFKIDQMLIATADAFQGSERKFMFVSTVRTSYHGLNFAASLRRVNVINIIAR